MKHYLGIMGIILCSTLLIWTTKNSFAIPQGPMSNLGSNPHWSIGGEANTSQTITLATASSSNALLITDVVLTQYGTNGNPCRTTVKLQTGSGDILGAYRIVSRDDYSYSYTSNSVSHAYASGLSVPAGESLVMVSTMGCGNLAYSFSGVHIHE